MSNCQCSIIVPTFREAKNIQELVSRISQAGIKHGFEVILVDDNSGDGIGDVVSGLQNRFPWLKLVERKGVIRSLSQSVIDGIKLATGDIIVIMDADLSHPPEKIPTMLDLVIQNNVDLVIGSRYIDGGTTDEIWPFSRKIASKLSALLARYIIGVNVKDPLSGFIAIKHCTYTNGATLAPIGWKISLELMVKCHCKNIIEVPIHFSQRQKGKSKMNVRVAVQYLQHIRRLAYYKLFSSS